MTEPQEPAVPRLPLADLKVLEFTHTVMGPSCGMVLADLGAEVFKVEPLDGDRTRRLTGLAAGFFACFNRNKRSVALDLKSADGLAAARRLIGEADVLIENYAPGTMDRLGLGWAAVHELNPRLVYCSLKGFLPGPYGKRPALDEIVQYMSGLAYMTGLPGRPLRAGASVVDILGGVFGVVAILAAVHDRRRTGEGQLVQSALFESAALLMSQHMAGESVTGVPAPPMAARVAAWAIYDPFTTADGQSLFLAVTTDGLWRRFAAAFERPDLLEDETLATNELRVAARDRLMPMTQALVSRRTLAELMSLCERFEIPFSPVARPSDLFDDPQLKFTGLLRTELGGGRETRLPGLPISMGGRTFGLRRQPPSVGAHNDEVLGRV